MIESGQHVVYGLISPRAGWLFYVGITSNLNRRLSQHRSSHNICASRAEEAAGTQALPVDTNAGSLNGRAANFQAADAGSIPAPASTPKRGPGRPRTITDMKVYKAMKQREYRARKK